MAKDGINRGGARAGAGRKPKALAKKMLDGDPGKRPQEKEIRRGFMNLQRENWTS